MLKGDIFYTNLPTPSGNPGREQTGSRPAVIISNNASPIVTVIPITSQKKAARYPHTCLLNPTTQNGLTTQSIALVFQLTGIDKSRLSSKIGSLDTKDLQAIDNEVRSMLSL